MDFFDRETRPQKQTRPLVWRFGLTILAGLVVNNLLLCPLVSCFTQRHAKLSDLGCNSQHFSFWRSADL